MHEEDVVQKILELFPKLYYFIPLIPPHKEKIEEKEIRVAEPIDAILWLTELLSEDERGNSVLQSHVEQLIYWWYPQANFSRTLSYLINTGCIIQFPDRTDRRRNRLQITALGKGVLERIKAERQIYIKSLTEKLTKEEREDIIRILDKLAQITWAELKEYVQRR